MKNRINKVLCDPHVACFCTFNWNFTFPAFRTTEAAFVRFIKFSFGYTQTPERQFAVFNDDFPAVTGQLETVCSWRFARCRYEQACSPIFIFNKCSYIIFDFDIAVFTEITESAYTLRHHIDRPLP
ncbi:hypothetical protein D3C86_1898830 [compost metagenome]